MRSMHCIFNLILLNCNSIDISASPKLPQIKYISTCLVLTIKATKSQQQNKFENLYCEFTLHAHDLLIFGIFVFIYITLLLQTSFNMHSAHHNSNRFHVSREIYEKLKIIKENHKRMFGFEFEHRLIQIFVFFSLSFHLFLIKTISYLNLYLSDTTSRVC